MTLTDYAEIVAALRAVPGVADADVEPDASGGGMGLLRLGLAPGYDEVQVATSVGRLLRERFGLGVDADHVQLVEDVDAREPARPAGAPPRPTIQHIQLVSSGSDVAARVTLCLGDRTAVGDATGPAAATDVPRTAARATLRAVEDLASGDVRLDLVYLEVAATGREDTVLACVTMTTGSGEERLTGAAVVRDDPRQAAVRATLDALNRRLGSLLS